MGRTCSIYSYEEKRNAYRILVGKPQRKRPLGRPEHKLEVNIRMDLREVGWGDVDWIHLAQERDHSNEPLGLITCRETL
jgi:hypothetical protein